MVGVCALLLRRVTYSVFPPPPTSASRNRRTPQVSPSRHSVTEECERAGRALLRVCCAGVSHLQRHLLPCCLVREVEELHKSVQVTTV